ncbi:MAG TPA: hypothetical protein EYQ41_02595 [Micavibrio sp.]|nr:hypothetical protein [Micavibrio sp.]
MTSYTGLPKRHVALVVEFRDALLRKMEDKGAVPYFEVEFAQIDLHAKDQAKRLGETAGSPKRAKNWKKVQRGWAEAEKLSLVFEAAQKELTAEEIASCVPYDIQEARAHFSRYEMEKNRLTHMEDYLVPKIIRDTGLY